MSKELEAERDALLDEEAKALQNAADLYLECLNGKPLKDRHTPQEIRDGLILFHHVYKVCRVMPEIKYRTALLTGELVPEYKESIRLKPIETYCPSKWAFIDLHDGHIYAWDHERQAWISPPRRALAALKRAIQSMKPPKKRKPR